MFLTRWILIATLAGDSPVVSAMDAASMSSRYEMMT
jgi:hypothetical protein